MSEERYIIGGSDGWLRVKRESNNEIISLPEYLHVEFQKNQGGRDHFIAREGVENGRSFSVKQGNLGKPPPSYKSAAQVFFYRSTQELRYSGGKIKAITAEGRAAIPPGMYPIQIPDFPHDFGTGYLSQSAYAKNWFYLGHGVAIPGHKDRYLHTGQISEGCVTVSPSGWTALYQYLILCRAGDEKNVGFITVYR